MQLMQSPSHKAPMHHDLLASLLGGLLTCELFDHIMSLDAYEESSLTVAEVCSQKKGTVRRPPSYAGRSIPYKNAIYFFSRGEQHPKQNRNLFFLEGGTAPQAKPQFIF